MTHPLNVPHSSDPVRPGGARTIRRSGASQLRRFAAVLLLLPSLGSRVVAQSGTVAGTVIDATSHRPLAEAVVSVPGTTASARTDGRGQFRLASLAGPTVTMRVARVGYQPATEIAPVGKTDVVIRLSPTVLKLDELVVTGTAGETQKRALGNVVGMLDLAATQQVAPSVDIQQALAVAVPGLQIQRASGQVGTGSITRIRGVGSISLSSEPIVFIDGVRANSSDVNTSAGMSGGGDVPSRINDIDPNEIESIQVLKGPSAATLYGTEASNGVIQIITKRGTPGRPVWTLESHVGANWLPHPEDRYGPIYYRTAGDPTGPIHELNLIKNDIARGFGSPFSTGIPRGGVAAVQGGTDAIRYFFSGGYDRDEGMVDYNWQNRLSAVGNLTFNSGEKLKIDLNLGYTRSRMRAASANQSLTAVLIWGCPNSSCGDPASGDGPDQPGRGYYGGYTPEMFELVEGYDDIDRMRTSFTLSHRPTTWLNHRLTVGGDFTDNRSSNFAPLGDGFTPKGFRMIRNERTRFITVDYSATGSITISPTLSSQTSGGMQYYQKQFDNFDAQSEKFPISTINTISGGAIKSGQELSDYNYESKTFGLYIQEQLAFNNRLFLTGAVRGDDNSAFGKNYNFVVYPKLSAAWVISEEPFLKRSAWLSAVKLRASWGKAGQQPDVFAATRTYGPSVGADGTGTVTPQSLGNVDLRPEVTRELEAGFDASLFKDRLSLEVTYYHKQTKDGLLAKPVSPAGTGFPGTQFINVGQFANKGLEVAMDGTVISRRDFRLNLRGTVALNTNRIDDLGQEPFGAFAQWQVTGFPINGLFLPKIVKATLESPGVVKDALCQGGANLSGGDGSLVDCTSAPLLYYGQSIPKTLASMSADITWKRLRLVAVAELQGGVKIIDGNIWASHVFFNNTLASLQGSDPLLEAIKLYSFETGLQSGIIDGSFSKLRNVSLTYDLPKNITGPLGASRGSFTVSGLNLVTLWRGQTGTFGARTIDPEVRPNTGAYARSYNLAAYNQESWPQSTRVLATVRLTF